MNLPGNPPCGKSRPWMVPRYANFLPLREHLIQIEEHITHHGPRRKIDWVHARGDRPQRIGGQSLGFLGMGCVILMCLVEQLDQPARTSATDGGSSKRRGSHTAPCSRSGAPFLHDAPGQCLGGFHIDGVVEGNQSLQRRVGARAAHGANGAAGSVKRDHGRIGRGPTPVGVQAAAIFVGAGAIRPVGAGAKSGGKAELGLRRTHRWPIHFRAQQPTHE